MIKILRDYSNFFLTIFGEKFCEIAWNQHDRIYTYSKLISRIFSVRENFPFFHASASCLALKIQSKNFVKSTDDAEFYAVNCFHEFFFKRD